MNIEEVKFNIAFHSKKSVKFNNFYMIFKSICLLSPFLIFLIFIYNSFLILLVPLFLFITSWLLSVKMRSLRNINIYAASLFKEILSEKISEIFK